MISALPSIERGVLPSALLFILSLFEAFQATNPRTLHTIAGVPLAPLDPEHFPHASVTFWCISLLARYNRKSKDRVLIPSKTPFSLRFTKQKIDVTENPFPLAIEVK